MTAGLRAMSDGISRLAGEMLALVNSLRTAPDDEVQRRLKAIQATEGEVDAAFDESATLIMGLEIFPVNPDYFLQIARELDRMSDLIERTCLLLEWRHSLNEEESELLESAASQVRQLAEDISGCMENLGKNKESVERGCAVVVEREKTVDQIMGHYTRLSSRKGYEIEKRLWLTDVLGNLDTVADGARDLTITVRVISEKLEKQSRLDVKHGVMN